MTQQAPQSEFFTLFDATSKDVQSPSFYINPGWVAEISAFGFDSSFVRPDPTRAKVLQTACLQKILLKTPLPVTHPEGCGGVINLSVKGADILAEGPVVVRGCGLGVSACNTVMCLAWPGLYRLVLNDPDALGVVQVYLQSYTKNTLGQLMSLSIGES
jgi:hypothetical protein